MPNKNKKAKETKHALDSTATPDEAHDTFYGSAPSKQPDERKMSKEEKLRESYEYQQRARALLRQKTQYQIRALFIKNYKLQARQVLTNVLQIATPIMGLMVLMFIREAVVESTSLFANQEINVPIPFYYNLPLKALSGLGVLFNVTDCDEWYMYSFNNETTTQEDIDYVGFNEGQSMFKPLSSGMLQGGKNILDYPCYKAKRAVPYFKHHDEKKKGMSMNAHVYDILDEMSFEFLDTFSKNNEIKGLDLLPDGMIEIGKANKENFAYRIQMNDYSIFQYHRNNGISKIGLI